MAIRIAKIKLNGFSDTAEAIARYLPSNYKIGYCNGTECWIIGEDECGWTLEYVIERLASGLFFPKEMF